MFAEYVIIAAQACQSGRCSTTEDSSVAAKYSLTATTTVTVTESPKTAPVIFLAPERPKRRLALPRLFQGPTVIICGNGGCK